jgi:hypothetical protein
MFIFVLYPYVYLMTRTAFIERASGMLEAGERSARPVAQLLPRLPAAGATGGGGRGVAGADGDAGRLTARCRISACRPSPRASIAPGFRSATALRRRNWPPRCSPSWSSCCCSSALARAFTLSQHQRAPPPARRSSPERLARRAGHRHLRSAAAELVSCCRRTCCCGWRSGKAMTQFGAQFSHAGAQQFRARQPDRVDRRGCWRCCSPMARACRRDCWRRRSTAWSASATRCPAR